MPSSAESRSRLYVIGAGGHAKVVLATALAQGWSRDAVHLVDDSPAAQGRVLLGQMVEGTSAPVLSDPGALAVLAIGANAARARLAAQARCRFATLVHPAATVHESVRLGAGTVVFAGAVIQPDATLGEHVILNTGASIDHDCHIGDVVHLAPGTRLAGGVRIGAGSFVGIGAVVLPGVGLGRDVTVGAGAAVIRDLPDGVTAVGVPARVLPSRATR